MKPREKIEPAMSRVDLATNEMNRREIHNAYLRGRLSSYKDITKKISDLDYFCGPDEIVEILENEITTFMGSIQ